MKYSPALALFALLGAASARSVLLAEEAAAQPMVFRNCGRDSDLVNVEKIEISPNPPSMGKKVHVKVTGELKKDIEQGAKIHVKLASGSFVLFNKELDLCETVNTYGGYLSGDNLKCPIKADKKTWEETVALPDFNIPAFIRNVNANLVLKTKTGEQIACQNVNWPLH